MKKYIIIFWLAFTAIAVKVSFAQLSPGDLSEAHANLEGLKNCQECHETGKQVSSQKCLACHKILNARISEGKGLHALEGHKDCILCHVEHLGRSADLIHWPGGMQAFDHTQVGYKLEGKHAELNCRQCHQAKNIANIDKFKDAGRNPERTFLGLQQNCLSCHRDEHRGQLTGACLSCHTFDGWRPATKFSHATTKFALTGKHMQVECAKCHKPVTDNKYSDDKDYLQFTVLNYGKCSDCHEDIHRGKFNQACSECHNTSGWKQTNLTEFDHAKTNFPLKGKHADLKCESCHPAGQALTGLKYARCLDCHQDYHQGQFANRPSGGDCNECHTESGFVPAKFTIDDHQKTKFKLEGAHLAIPCLACHKKITNQAGVETMQFDFKSSRCADCHKDPHAGEADKYAKAEGCRNCHNVDSWRKISFDHKLTGFALEGKHSEVACRKCHLPVNENVSQHSLRFTGLKKACESCHDDIHQGQFTKQIEIHGVSMKITDCDRCHTSTNWAPRKFNHNRDTAFKLEGAHESVKCDGCHQKVNREGKTFTWFKPIDTSCEHCHGENVPKEKRGDS